MKCTHMVLRRIKATDEHQSGYVFTPCGVCENCRKNFAHMWGTRVFHESLSYEKNCFVTLTYSPDNIPMGFKGYPTLDISDLQKFFKSWREYIYPDKIRYFAGCEYSPNNHLPHYHIAVFGASLWDKRVFSNHVPRDGGYSVDCRFWDKGFVHVGNLEPGSANYVAGYALKKVMGSSNRGYYENLGITPPRALMSRRPGIGCDFMRQYADVMRRLGNTTVNGVVVGLPRYYADSICFKETDCYKERKEENAERQLKIWSEKYGGTVEQFQQSIKEHLELCEQYDWNESYHTDIVEANERCLK